jgi:hypothetical protein
MYPGQFLVGCPAPRDNMDVMLIMRHYWLQYSHNIPDLSQMPKSFGSSSATDGTHEQIPSFSPNYECYPKDFYHDDVVSGRAPCRAGSDGFGASFPQTI